MRTNKVSRAGFYRYPPSPPEQDPDMGLQDAIQRVALDFPGYGWPRMTAELKRLGGESQARVPPDAP